MKETTLFLVVLVALTFQSPTNSANTNSLGQWQILTKQNFSSQITLNSHILLIISTPWSGESRSLMKEITEIVKERKQEFSSLKLMQMYGNKEKMLAKSIGVVTEDLTVVYFHHSLSYNYNGKIRAKSILFSISSYLSVAVEDVALNVVRNEVELREFVELSDKAVILFEFCGWTEKVLANGKSNGTESDFGSKGAFTAASFNGESNGILTMRGKENPKVDGVENVNLKCGGENELAGVPWVGEFSSVNGSTMSMENDTQDARNGMLGTELSCTFEEFQKFDAFFSNFMNVAREFFLPPEKHRFGVVSDRSLLSSLGVGDAGSWLAMLYFSGCPSCSKTLKEGEDLRDALKMSESIVRELEGDGPGLDPAVPSSTTSVLLFVDRSSELLEIREKSKEALVALRELALRYQISHLTDEDNGGKTGHHTIVSRHPKLKLSLASQKTKLKDKVSVMIVNEGKHAILGNMASDLEGSSLQEILTQLLQQKKEAKLSSVAKEVGFQLLSGDFNFKSEDTSPTTSEPESGKVSIVSPPPEERFVGKNADLDKGSDLNHDKRSQNVDVISSSKDSEEKTYSDMNQNLEHLQSQLLDLGRALENSEAIQGEENKFSQVADMGQEELPFQSFKVSFFFSDGNYRLLEALTGETRIPTLVIIDPILQQHYVFPGQSVLSYSSVENFLHAFLNRSIVPYQHSKSRPKTPREGVHPPFVNLDFHEADSIPQVTSHTFSEQVLGLNHSDNDNSANAWKEDVVVLFSNSWCGFCQRMELIVREVYRAIKGYASRLKAVSMDEKTLLTGDNIKNVIEKMPKIFLMDCTLNDCNFILKSVDQREVYPSLLLFPAERKTAIPYEGDLAITDIIKFIANQGSYSQHLIGVVRTPGKKREHNWNFYEHLSRTAGHNDVHARKEKDTIHEVLLKNRIPNKVEYNRIQETAQVVVGSILIASEKINTQPFDNSMILIVKADSTGFQGLIYNKPIGWDATNELAAQLELLKEAPLSFGGPLVKRGMPLVALTRRAVEGQYPEVAPGMYYLGQKETLHEVEELKSGNRSLTDFWFFLGFSRWGWNQLFDEIAGGGWSLSENSTEHLSWPL